MIGDGLEEYRPPGALPLSAAPYRDRVIMRLIEHGAAIELSAAEDDLIRMGEQYAVGPNDCACQIISDRSDAAGRPDDDDPNDRCTNPGGHAWVYTGTAYGGDDPRWCGEGRCYCQHCGADGDT